MTEDRYRVWGKTSKISEDQSSLWKKKKKLPQDEPWGFLLSSRAKRSFSFDGNAAAVREIRRVRKRGGSASKRWLLKGLYSKYLSEVESAHFTNDSFPRYTKTHCGKLTFRFAEISKPKGKPIRTVKGTAWQALLRESDLPALLFVSSNVVTPPKHRWSVPRWQSHRDVIPAININIIKLTLKTCPDAIMMAQKMWQFLLVTCLTFWWLVTSNLWGSKGHFDWITWNHPFKKKNFAKPVVPQGLLPLWQLPEKHSGFIWQGAMQV